VQPLGHFEKRVWEPNPGAVGGRRRRTGGPYEAFVPASIAERSFALREDAVSAVSAGAQALVRLNTPSADLGSLNALAANLLRSESAASSLIEGLEISQKRLARAAYTGRRGGGGDNRDAEVLGNVDAMKRAIALGAESETLKVNDIKAVHETLLRFTADRKIAGVVREEQNWIGGNDFNPIGAVYVPPPPEYVPDLLQDLCDFAAREDLAPVVQAAIVHAQFENIHPFADGNGRVGRALIYTVLRKRGEAAHYIPPISLVLGAEKRNYINGFGAYSSGDVSTWVETFADATERAAQKAQDIATEIESAQAGWIDRLGQPRKDATVLKLVAALPGQPVIDVAAGQLLTGRSHVAVQTALGQLEEAGILNRLNEKKWGRVWECDELLDLVEAFEEDIKS
jgi:Fic family protein